MKMKPKSLSLVHQWLPRLKAEMDKGSLQLLGAFFIIADRMQVKENAKNSVQLKLDRECIAIILMEKFNFFRILELKILSRAGTGEVTHLQVNNRWPIISNTLI